MKVCHVVNAVGPMTGPANHACALEKYTDFRAGVLAWYGREPFDQEEILYRSDFVDAPDSMLGIDAESYRRARRILDDYDALHVHHPHSGTFCKLLGRRLDKALVTTEGSNHDKFTKKGRIANGLTNPLCDRVTCVSGSVLDSFPRWERALLPDKKVEIVYTGVDLEKIDRRETVDWSLNESVPYPDDAVLVGTAARLSRMKAHDTLIRATKIANEESDRPVHLVIAGDGPLREELETLARREGVADRVHFLGMIQRLRVYQMMSELDLYAMPSRWEGFCSAVLEAMAIETPCVLSDIPSFRETFSGVAAFHRLDDPESLATELCRLAADPSYRSELASAARNRVEERYTMEQTAREYADLYREAVE